MVVEVAVAMVAIVDEWEILIQQRCFKATNGWCGCIITQLNKIVSGTHLTSNLTR